jgi:uncharacterized surface protein with fasciclin (FAS1) repeats
VLPVRAPRYAGVAAAAALVVLTVAGCGTTPPPTASPTGAPPVPTSAPSAAATHVGTGCGFIPVHGSGSFSSMSTQRAATAAASNPELSVFSSAIRAAALRGQLDAMRSFTLFVPVNSAFSALSGTDISFLRRPANLVKVVRRNVVPTKITPAQIAHGGSVTSLSGAKLVLTKRGSAYRVDAATVICGNIKTANGTIYVIDKVLLPVR